MTIYDQFQDRFSLTRQENAILSDCVSFYGNPITSFEQLIKRIMDDFKQLWGSSKWQTTKAILKNKSVEIINSDYSNANGKHIAALSEFALRFLTTHHAETKKREQAKQQKILSYCTAIYQFIYNKKLIDRKFLDLSLDEVLLRAPKGNGSTLPDVMHPSPLVLLQTSISFIKYNEIKCEQIEIKKKKVSLFLSERLLLGQDEELARLSALEKDETPNGQRNFTFIYNLKQECKKIVERCEDERKKPKTFQENCKMVNEFFADYNKALDQLLLINIEDEYRLRKKQYDIIFNNFEKSLKSIAKKKDKLQKLKKTENLVSPADRPSQDEMSKLERSFSTYESNPPKVEPQLLKKIMQDGTSALRLHRALS